MRIEEAHRKATGLFRKRGWRVFKFQRDAWKAYASGESGLVHAPTGTGKTYAVWFPPLAEWMTGQRRGKPLLVCRSCGLRLYGLWSRRKLSLLELCDELRSRGRWEGAWGYLGCSQGKAKKAAPLLFGHYP